MKKFVILGGGYGGLAIANRLLEGDIPSDTIITLVDRMPYQGLKTEFYALAAGTISDLDVRVAFPSDPRIEYKYGAVTGIDLESRTVTMDQEETIEYEWLAIALGCTDKHHGIPGADQYTASIQSLANTRKTYAILNDVKPYGEVNIIGGGLSGVEIAAELRESRPDLNIRILDRGPRVLSAFPEKLSQFVSSWFVEHDIALCSHISVSKIEPGVIYDQERPIYGDVAVWTAGIQPSEVVQKLNVPKDAQGRILLNEYYQIPSYPEVYVAGDCASLAFSPSAQVAGVQGDQIAQVVQAIWQGQTPRLDKIRLKGVLGSLGKKSGFGYMGKRTFIGRVPRLLKMGVLWKSKHHFG